MRADCVKKECGRWRRFIGQFLAKEGKEKMGDSGLTEERIEKTGATKNNHYSNYGSHSCIGDNIKYI